jgi:signal transduction histidine kinase/CheY-like chemotaxis protein
MSDAGHGELTEPDPPPSGGRYARYAFAVAAILTITMLGWQAWHLFESPRNVEHEETGACPTRAVAELHFEAAHHDDLIDDLEHALVIAPASEIAPWAAEWRGNLEQSARELDQTVNRAVPLVTPELAEAVLRVDAASAEIDAAATAVVDEATRRDLPGAVEMLNSSAYLDARGEYRDAVESLVTDSQRFFQGQLQSEHRDELVSVAVAVAIFAATIGAWAVFLRRIRLGQRQLAEESRQRHQAEAELLQAQKMEAVGTMASGVAHDFNNIVTAIWGSAGQAGSQIEADSPARSSLARIEAACEQANGLVRSLLTLGRRPSFERRPVDLGALIDETATLMETVIPPSIEVATTRDPGRGPWVLGDRALLQQAVMNLVLNARDAMPEGGRLGLAVRDCSSNGSAGERMCVEVSDTGAGMTPEVLSRIFEPFFTTRERGRGTGLGLAMVRSIVDGHGGEVRCDSIPGSGTVFTISLPRIDEPPMIAEIESGEGDDVLVVGRGTVLLAEDHRQVREVLTGALEAAGYEVVPTASGPEFLEAHARLADDLVAMVVDLEIPEPDGLACVRQLRAEGVRTPILLITGTPAPGLESKAGDLAVVLRKPFPMRRLMDLLAGSSHVPAGRHG